MKIAFLSSLDPADIHSWSGTLYHIYKTISKKHEVTWMGNKELAEVHQFHIANMGETHFIPEKYALLLGKLLTDRLQDDFYDLIICRDSFLYSYLITDIPLVFIGDTTFQLFNEYLGIKDADLISLSETIERTAFQKADLLFFSSEWAKRSVIEQYQVNPEKVHVIEFGANMESASHGEESLNQHTWYEQMEKIVEKLIQEKNDTYIPVYVINMKDRTERRNHIMKEFEGRKEFDVTIVEACTHEKGTIGLWNSIIKVIHQAQENEDEVIIICEDDHYFTEHYSPGLLWKEIQEAYMQGADLLSGGIGGFGHAVRVGYHRYWVDWLWCTQFVVVYKHFFDTILSYEFKEDDTADGVFSELTTHKMVIYPFISEQKDFGYSDVTQSNMDNQGKIRQHFAWANRLFEMLRQAEEIFCVK